MNLQPSGHRDPQTTGLVAPRSVVARRAGLLTSAALGAGVLAGRAATRAARVAYALPKRAVETVAEVPEIKSQLTELEREWLAFEQRTFAAIQRELDRIVPVLTDYIIDRIDMKAMAAELIEDMNIPDMVRDSSSAMVLETIEDLKIENKHLDAWVTRTVDRVLRRHGAAPLPTDRPVPLHTDHPGDPRPTR